MEDIGRRRFVFVANPLRARRNLKIIFFVMHRSQIAVDLKRTIE